MHFQPEAGCWDRDEAVVFKDKAASVRNKRLQYKFEFSEKDITAEGKALIEKGFNVEARQSLPHPSFPLSASLPTSSPPT